MATDDPSSDDPGIRRHFRPTRGRDVMKKQLAAVGVAGVLSMAGIAVPAVAMGRNPTPGPASGMGMGMGMGMGSMHGMHVTSEAGYLVHMIPHHEEAIEAAAHLARSDRPEMRAFGETIIRTQSAEVDQMDAWLTQWHPSVDRSVDYHPMMRDLSGLSGDALDQAFLQDMIPHHMMAVMMSQQLLNRSLVEHGDVTPFAAEIRDTQMAEIHQMRAWLGSWFSAPQPSMGRGGMGRGGMGGMGMGRQGR
jgi:uncharacterized protein (DUF305 family)